MRSFHTGGVFWGNVIDQIQAPLDGVVVYKTAVPGILALTNLQCSKLQWFCEHAPRHVLTPLDCLWTWKSHAEQVSDDGTQYSTVGLQLHLVCI